MNLPDMANLSCSNKSLFGRSELCSLVTLRVERLLKVDLVHVRDFMSNDLDRFCDPYIIAVSKGHLVSNIRNLPRDGVVRILFISVSCIRGVVGFDFE